MPTAGRAYYWPRPQLAPPAEGMKRSDDERKREIQARRLATRARNEAERRARMSEAERAAEDAAAWAARSARSRRAWEKRRAEGRAGYGAEKQAAITAKRLASTARNRAARLAAMAPEERLRELADRSRRRREGCRRGWRTRRENLGLPPNLRAEPTRPCSIYERDVHELLRYHHDPKAAVRLVLEGLRLAVAAGAVALTDAGWRLARP